MWARALTVTVFALGVLGVGCRAEGSAVTPATHGAEESTRVDDGIDALVLELSTRNGLWINGLTPALDAPAGAVTAAVLDSMFDRLCFDSGRVSSFTIVAERDVLIPPDPEAYRAVRVRSDQGELIVLMRWGQEGWWTRAFPR
jgi:hypothetical protein